MRGLMNVKNDDHRAHLMQDLFWPASLPRFVNIFGMHIA